MALERAEVKRRLAQAKRERSEFAAELAALEGRVFSASVLGVDGSDAAKLGLQVNIDELDREIASLDLQLLQMTDREHERVDALGAEREKLREERRQFWFRRFHLSIGLGHGAGLAAIGSKIFDSSVAATTVASTWWAFVSFAFGLVVAGLLPVALYFERTTLAWRLSAVSALLFVWALIVACAAAFGKAELVLPG